MKRHRNPELGIKFDYPTDWVSVENCRILYGVDVFLRKDFTNFGILRVSEQLREECAFLNYEQEDKSTQLSMVLKSSVQHNEMILEDVELNKYRIDKANSATILLTTFDNRSGGNIIHERTLLIQDNVKMQCFMVGFEDLSENYEIGQSQLVIKAIFDSFRFV